MLAGSEDYVSLAKAIDLITNYRGATIYPAEELLDILKFINNRGIHFAKHNFKKGPSAFDSRVRAIRKIAGINSVVIPNDWNLSRLDNLGKNILAAFDNMLMKS